MKSSGGGSNDLFLVAGMIGVLFILFAPIPPGLLDFLLILNFTLALLILLVTFYTEKPLKFSTFPSLLLMATLFRLALNISATRLILGDADAGKVIGAVGEHVVGGNYVIGLVVFLILIVVQYVVVTTGAQRVAEVAARFTLDSMPGKQMSIDADLNMGIIDHEEAKARRGALEREASFYGAMDGASKFVKGDAIAGIVIILIDIIGGLSIGMAQHGMQWREALHQYTLLTVGDGIVTQIPSLVIAVATGIIITRAATDSRLADEIGRQFSSHPKVFLIVAAALSGLLLLPNMPILPVIVVIGVLAGILFLALRFRDDDANSSESYDQAVDKSGDVDAADHESSIAPFELVLAKNLADRYAADDADLESRIDAIRRKFSQGFGLSLPTLTIRPDAELTSDSYQVFVNGLQVGRGRTRPESLLAINPGTAKLELDGEETREPTYGLKAKWIDPEIRSQAKAAGYTLVEPEVVLTTHVQELCKRNAAQFVTRSQTEAIVERRRDHNGSLVDDLVPGLLSYSDIQAVLQGLLEEQVSIRNIDSILEVLVDHGRQVKDPPQLIEKVRERLGPAICAEVSDDEGRLNTLTISPDLEQKLIMSVTEPGGNTGVMKPNEIDRFLANVARESERMLNRNLRAVLLCAAPIRRELKRLLSRSAPFVSVISMNEVVAVPEIQSTAVIGLERSTERRRPYE